MMFGIDRTTWTLVSPLLDRALDLPPDELDAWLEALRRDRPPLAAILDDLLRHHAQASAAAFLDASPGHEPRGVSGLTVGAYTLESPLGSGGMGTVWRARRSDGRFDGAVAVKLLHASALDAAGAARFAREATALARLSHPHIARLYDAGVTPGGQPYLVLQLIEGRRIDDYVEAMGLDVDARLALFADVCDAVAHAHAHLVVHRDIKPSNILVADDGRPALLDFGIARLLESDEPQAAGGATVVTALTPEFASPEQVRGDSLSTATDVYSLGVLLYRLLTDRHPTGEGLTSALAHARAIVEQDPRPPSTVAPADRRRRLAGDLDVIAATALRKTPGERYPSVDALAADLRRHLKDEPIVARAESATYRAGKFVRRHRTSVAAAAVVVTALGAAAAGLWVQGRHSARDRDFALRQLARAEAALDLNEFLLTDAAPDGRPFTAGDLLARAEAVLTRHPVDPPDPTTVESLVSIGNQFQSMDQDGNARRVLTRAFDLAQQLPAGEAATRAVAGCALANTLARGDLADLRRAESLVAESLRMIPDGRPFALDRARCERSAAVVARHAGDAGADVTHMSASRRLLQESGLGSPIALLGADLGLANSYRAAGRMVEAEAAMRSGVDRMRALGRDRTEQMGTLLNDWGLTLWLLGRPAQADAAFREALQISRGDGAEANVSPMLLVNAARPVLDLGRIDEAMILAERATVVAAERDDQVVQLMALLFTASAHREKGDPERAAALYDDAGRRLRASLPVTHPAFASLALQQARVALDRRQLPEAALLADDAVARSEASPATADLLSQALHCRAEIALADGRPGQAADDARRGIEVEARRSDPSQASSRLGRLYLVLGEARLAAGDRDGAREALQRAAAQLDATVGAGHKDSGAAQRLLASLN
jgi:serine/threonine-protein kinase